MSLLPVESLTPNARNARLHSARQIGRIADSIAAFGFNVPVLIDADGVVLAGHGRLMAAKRLGLKEVPTIRLDHLSEAGRRAFMLADNRLAERASWDDGRLAVELSELKRLDLDFGLPATGFELEEIDLRIGAGVSSPDSPSRDGRPSGRPVARVGRGGRPGRIVLRDPPLQLAPTEGAGEAIAQAGEAVARPGDTWALGPHRLACALAPDAGAYLAIDAAIRRWQALSGESARLHPGGPAFEEVERAGRRPKAADPRGDAQ